jgi:drug/metabolite transporter (DMT)-like permease
VREAVLFFFIVVAGAKAFMGERVSRNRWIGIAVVCLGVTFVWWSGR